jgi:hypothetical protein
MPNAGLTRRGDHRTFYKFGLVDPQDKPYAAFRFYYRTWGTDFSFPALFLRLLRIVVERRGCVPLAE